MEFLHELAIAAIMKDEGHYLKEWLDFHLLAGVTHFYLYDNGSTDNTKEILQPYVARGVVTYAYRPDTCEQIPAYRDAVRRYRFLCKYIAFLDLDEFLYAPDGRSLPEVIQELEDKYGDHGSFTANWCCYASSDEKKPDYSRGVLDRFVWRISDDHDHNKHVKSIIDPRKSGKFFTPHAPRYFIGNYGVDEDGHPVYGFFNERRPIQKLRINHYHVKSYAEWMERRSRNRADLGTPVPRDLDAWFKELDCRDIHDTGILEYREARKFIPQKKDDQGQFILQLANRVQTYLQEQDPMDLVELLGSIQNVCQLLPEYLDDQQVALLAEQLMDHLYTYLSEDDLQAGDVELFLDMLPFLIPLISQEKRSKWRRRIIILMNEVATLENKVAHNHSQYHEYDQLAQIFASMDR